MVTQLQTAQQNYPQTKLLVYSSEFGTQQLLDHAFFDDMKHASFQEHPEPEYARAGVVAGGGSNSTWILPRRATVEYLAAYDATCRELFASIYPQMVQGGDRAEEHWPYFKINRDDYARILQAAKVLHAASPGAVPVADINKIASDLGKHQEKTRSTILAHTNRPWNTTFLDLLDKAIQHVDPLSGPPEKSRALAWLQNSLQKDLGFVALLPLARSIVDQESARTLSTAKK
jgi:hypothetical protein